MESPSCAIGPERCGKRLSPDVSQLVLAENEARKRSGERSARAERPGKCSRPLGADHVEAEVELRWDVAAATQHLRGR